MKAAAYAHPVQGLVKYCGPLDERIPFHDSISVSTAPLKTVVTFSFQDVREITVNGVTPDPETLSRIDAVISEVKRLSGIEEEYKVVSQSDVPDKGLEASSGCAALTVAAAKAAGLDFSHRELSRIARRGAGPASRAVTGWFSRWKANMDEEFSYSFVLEDDLDMGMMAAFVEPLKMKRMDSSLIEYRLKSVHTLLYEMERAIKDHDIPKIGELAEKDSIILHGIMGEISPQRREIMAEVKALREEGIEAYFSSDVGGIYINSYPEDLPLIEERISGVRFVRLSVGGEARFTDL